MIVFALPLLILIVVAVAVVSTQQHHHATPDRLLKVGMSPGAQPSGVPPSRTIGTAPSVAEAVPLPVELDSWVAAGLISREQADAILEHERAALALPPAPAARPRRIPVVAEALGYLGGILGVVGVAVVVSSYWSDLSAAGRLAVSGLVAALFVAAGAVVREDADPAFARMRWFLWLLGTAAAGLFGGVVAADLFSADSIEALLLGGALAVTVVSLALWQWKPRPVQQFTSMAGLLWVVGVFGIVIDSMWVAAASVWVLAAAIFVVGVRHLAPVPWIALAVGAVGVVVGPMLLTDQEATGYGLLAASASGLAVLAVAVLPRLTLTAGERACTAVVAGATLLLVLPGTIGYFAEDAGILTGLTIWTGGCLMLAAAMRRLVRAPILVEAAGGLAVVAGAALTGIQSAAFATVFGLVSAIALLALGTLPGAALLSVFGSVGLLVNVPWMIGYYFPGKGRVPLLIAVAGLLMVLVAVLMARASGRIRKESSSG